VIKLVGLPVNGLNLSLATCYVRGEDSIGDGFPDKAKLFKNRVPRTLNDVALLDLSGGPKARCPSRAKSKVRKAKSGEDSPWMGGFEELDWSWKRSKKVA